jgi:hypothetical protein
MVESGIIMTMQSRSRADSGNSVKPLGYYLNVKHAGGDAYGYSLQLWQQDEHIFGLFAAYVGPEADPPTGLLEEVKFNSRTKQLSFKAHLSKGPIYGRGYEGTPSKDIFQFRGELSGERVTGVLAMSNGLFPNDRPKLQTITLRRSAELTEQMHDSKPKTYDQWKTWADEILKRRGPKL